VSATTSRIVVAGIGNEYRQDDGAGVAVANAIVASFPAVRDIGPIAEPLDLIGKWDFADLALVIDATRSGSPPGTILLTELDDEGAGRLVQAAHHTSTHGLGIPDVLRLSRILHAAPTRVVLVGIEGRDFGDGASMCDAVEDSIPHAAALVIQLIAEAVHV
jgi:hydrogenase maturation protease